MYLPSSGNFSRAFSTETKAVVVDASRPREPPSDFVENVERRRLQISIFLGLRAGR